MSEEDKKPINQQPIYSPFHFYEQDYLKLEPVILDDEESQALNEEANLQRKIVMILKKIKDPEIPDNIFDLGLIYDLDLKDLDLHVKMTLTAPNCPVADQIQPHLQENLEKFIPELKKVTIELVWDPPWHKDLMSEEAKLELDLF